MVRKSVVAAVITFAASSLPVACSAHGAGDAGAAQVAVAAPALSTDQPCTAHAPRGARLRVTPYRTDDLKAMTLSRAAYLPSADGYQTDWLRYGYIDNVELPKIELAVPKECALNRATARIVGFERGYVGAAQNFATATQVFFTPAGAAQWLRRYVAGLRGAVGTGGVTAVQTRSLTGPGSDAVLATLSLGATDLTYELFRNRDVVGWVVNGRAAGSVPAESVRSIAKRLAGRMSHQIAAIRARAKDPTDAAIALSAGLPQSRLGARYAGLSWDWFYGGCWDATEAASQTSSPAEHRQYLADATRYGMLTFCRAMYAPKQAGAALKGVYRVFTGGTLYKTAAGAGGALAATAREWKDRGGKTIGGVSYGPLTQWAVGPLGEQSRGFRQRAGDMVLIRAYVQRGRYVEIAAVNARSGTTGTGDVKRWAGLLDQRFAALSTDRVV